MLKVPQHRQPDPVACLPTCVYAVLQFQGEDAEFVEIREACHLGPLGAVDELALQGLREAGWDIELLQEFDPDTIKAAIEEERPIIMVLAMGVVGEQALAHAVVVCDLEGDQITVMDPLVGRYVTFSLTETGLQWGHGFSAAFLIAGVLRDEEPDLLFIGRAECDR